MPQRPRAPKFGIVESKGEGVTSSSARGSPKAAPLAPPTQPTSWPTTRHFRARRASWLALSVAGKLAARWHTVAIADAVIVAIASRKEWAGFPYSTLSVGPLAAARGGSSLGAAARFL